MGDLRLGSRSTLRRRSAVVVALCLTASLAACGGDDEETAAAVQTTSTTTGTTTTTTPSATPPSTSSGNRAPTISGTPATQTLQGRQYSFTPTASDADGNSLTFRVANAPAWATFTSSSGRLRGTPTAAQVGTYSNIQISVSDGTNTTTLPAFSIAVVATATGTAALTWNPPTQNTDGTSLTNLAGYKVYWGPAQGDYTNSVTITNAGLSSYVVEQLTPATWFFALTALNAAGMESGHSNVASKQVL